MQPENVVVNVNATLEPSTHPQPSRSFFLQALNGIASIPIVARRFRVMIILLITLLLILLWTIFVVPIQIRSVETQSSSIEAKTVRYESRKDILRFYSTHSTGRNGSTTTLEMVIPSEGSKVNVTTLDNMTHDTWFRLLEEGLSGSSDPREKLSRGVTVHRSYPAALANESIVEPSPLHIYV